MLPLTDCVVVAAAKIAPPSPYPPYPTCELVPPLPPSPPLPPAAPSWENALPPTNSVVPWKKIPPPAPRPPNATCGLVPPPSPLPPLPPRAESWENVLPLTESVVLASAKIAPPWPMPPVPVATPSTPAAPTAESLENVELTTVSDAPLPETATPPPVAGVAGSVPAAVPSSMVSLVSVSDPPLSRISPPVEAEPPSTTRLLIDTLAPAWVMSKIRFAEEVVTVTPPELGPVIVRLWSMASSPEVNTMSVTLGAKSIVSPAFDFEMAARSEPVPLSLELVTVIVESSVRSSMTSSVGRNRARPARRARSRFGEWDRRRSFESPVVSLLDMSLSLRL